MRKRLASSLMVLLLLILVVIGFQSAFVPSESMLPNLKVGDHLLVVRSWLAYPGGKMPARGDIITFKLPLDLLDAHDNGKPLPPVGPAKVEFDILIKRVIGLPGDTVQVIGRQVLVNGKPLHEDYITYPPPDGTASDYNYAGARPLKVPPEALFVLGDNRKTSDDGRYWGTLNRKYILGKFVAVLYNEGANGINSERPH